MTKICTLIFILVFSISCGEKNQIDEIDIIEDREFVEAEIKAAQDICTALKDKRNYFEKEAQNYNTRHNIKLTECNSSVSNKQISLNLVRPFAGSIYWDGPRGANYFKDVLTDQTQSIKIICSNVFAGNTPRTVITDGLLKSSYTFSADENFGYITIKDYKKENASDKFKMTSQEAFKIILTISSRTSNPRLYGVISDRDKANSCDNGNSKRLRQIKI